VSGSTVEFLCYTLPPHTAAGPFPAHANGTIEHIHVAAGRIRILLGADAAALEAGDSCSCLADAPHGFDNRDGEVEARIYVVIEPP
jgi:quercetin dioxygenase-like cupin family protein